MESLHMLTWAGCGALIHWGRFWRETHNNITTVWHDHVCMWRHYYVILHDGHSMPNWFQPTQWEQLLTVYLETVPIASWLMFCVSANCFHWLLANWYLALSTQTHVPLDPLVSGHWFEVWPRGSTTKVDQLYIQSKSWWWCISTFESHLDLWK